METIRLVSAQRSPGALEAPTGRPGTGKNLPSIGPQEV